MFDMTRSQYAVHRSPERKVTTATVFAFLSLFESCTSYVDIYTLCICNKLKAHVCISMYIHVCI